MAAREGLHKLPPGLVEEIMY